jgi:hypothetical protein
MHHGFEREKEGETTERKEKKDEIGEEEKKSDTRI